VTWIRWETTAPQHELVGALAEGLKIRRAEALGLWSAVCSGFGEYRKDGLAGAVTDTTLESWALWEGKRGRFAEAFREHCVERRDGQRDAAGVVRGWWRQDALLREQERSRHRPGQGSRKAPDDHGDGPETATERPRNIHAVPLRGNGDGYVDGTTTTPLPGAVEGALRDVTAVMPDPRHGEALRALLRRAPNPFGFLGTVRAVLDGLHPMNPRPTPAQVGEALVDLDANGKPPEAVIFRAYCERAAKPRTARRASDPPAPTTPAPTFRRAV